MNRENRYLRGLLSALFPGLGQLAGREYRRAALFGLPIAALLLATTFVVAFGDRMGVATQLLDANAWLVLIAIQLAVLAVRLASVLLALGPRALRAGRGAIVALVLVLFVAVPQVWIAYASEVARETVATVFEPSNAGAYVPQSPPPSESLDPSDNPLLEPSDVPSTTPPPMPSGNAGRVTVLLIGVDAGVGRVTFNTDTMIIASLDPTGQTVSMLSIPRDTVDVPLADGRVWHGKINSLAAWAKHHMSQFPGAPSGEAVLAAALSRLTGVEIDYWVEVNLPGFVHVVNSVGGVDVTITRGFCDPNYDEYGMNGFAVTPGRYHMNGNQALAYARIRHAAGESDFTRAQRQQDVIVAMRDRLVRGGFLNDPIGLLRSLGETIKTNVPPSVISQYASLGTTITRGHVYSEVVDSPLVYSGSDSRGYVLLPNIAGIRALAARLFPPAGTAPVGFSPLVETSTGTGKRLPTLNCHPAPATPAPTPSASHSPSPTPNPTATSSAPATPSPSPSPSATAPTPGPTPTPTPSATEKSTPAPSASSGADESPG